MSFLDTPVFSTRDPDAYRLFDLLVNAYQSKPQIVLLIESAGIRQTEVNLDGAVRDVWLGILRYAAANGKVRQLVETAADDPTIAAYHSHLQPFLDAPIEPMSPGKKIFISYRRNDAAYPAGWLFDRLADRFGVNRVFKDVDSIELGDDFVATITAAVESCAVLLAVIGIQWLEVTDEHGQRRLDDPKDFVRLEIEAALERDVRIIPVLVEGARMPRSEQLPTSLAKLARNQALELSPAHFGSDLERLLRALDRILAESAS